MKTGEAEVEDVFMFIVVIEAEVEDVFLFTEVMEGGEARVEDVFLLFIEVVEAREADVWDVFLFMEITVVQCIVVWVPIPDVREEEKNI